MELDFFFSVAIAYAIGSAFGYATGRYITKLDYEDMYESESRSRDNEGA